MEDLVDQQQKLVLNPGGDREPVQPMADGRDMLIPRGAGQDPCSRVLDRLKHTEEFCQRVLQASCCKKSSLEDTRA